MLSIACFLSKDTCFRKTMTRHLRSAFCKSFPWREYGCALQPHKEVTVGIGGNRRTPSNDRGRFRLFDQRRSRDFRDTCPEPSAGRNGDLDQASPFLAVSR